MIRFLFTYVLLSSTCFCFAQNSKTDSLDRLIHRATSDTQRINLMVEKIRLLTSDNLDSSIALAAKTIEEARRIHYQQGEASARIYQANNYCFTGNYTAANENLTISNQLLAKAKDSAKLTNLYNVYGTMYAMQNKYDSSHYFYKKGVLIATHTADRSMLSTLFQNDAISYQQQSNFPLALQNYQKALQVAEERHDEEDEAYISLNIGITHAALGDTARAEPSFFQAIRLAQKLDLKNVQAYAYANLSSMYSDQNKYAEQYSAGMKAAALGKQISDAGIEASSLSRAASALAFQNQFVEATRLNRQAIKIADSSKQPYNIYQAYSSMGQIFTLQKEYSEAIPFFENAFRYLTDADLYNAEIGKSYSDLAECYEKTSHYKEALTSFKMATQIADSIRGKENVRKATELTMNYEFDKKQQAEKLAQARKDAVTQKEKNQQLFVIAALALVVLAVVIIALIQFRNNKQKRKANLLLERQKWQIEQQRDKVESTLLKLQTTQAQLIQSEKMASLGELTAGIAHEIQNPLNFVNNFSELNNELIEEIRTEKLTLPPEEHDDLLTDIFQNNEKINHHGKRADAIVKGMLLHSRQSKGVKEPTDLNALCVEYLRLSYHGLRAKDKFFNADFIADFDESIGKVNLVPQDMGRVLLNLFNNAFYAVSKPPTRLKGEQYKPTVSVSTRKVNSSSGAGSIEIKISDNGSGIPKNIMDKIFQPFFTTKPTGQGTGLGLSLAYDIITKEHGGTIKAESMEGEGSVFVIVLPK